MTPTEAVGYSYAAFFVGMILLIEANKWYAKWRARQND